MSGVDPDGHCPAGVKCSDVVVHAEVTKPPEFKPLTPTAPGSLESQGGVSGQVTDTVTKKGKSIDGVQVNETISNSTERKNGRPDTATTTHTGSGETRNGGKVNDIIGKSIVMPGTSESDNAAVKQDFCSNRRTMEYDQTLTLTFPGGQSCSAKFHWSFGNSNGDPNNPSGNTGLNFTISPAKQDAPATSP
jgi:hypothetical protein